MEHLATFHLNHTPNRATPPIMTSFNRRFFLKSSCLAACAGALEAGRSVAAVVTTSLTRTLATPLPLTEAEEAVLTFVSQYSSNVRLVGLGVLLKLRGGETREAHLLVEVSGSAAFDAALAGKTLFGGAYSEGNKLYFVRDGIEFTVENLRPAALTQRLTELATIKSIAFAHDALVYDPATRALVDPFGAEKGGTLKLVNTTLAGGAAIGAALRGRVESARLSVNPDGKFTTWQTRNLNLSSSDQNADAVAEAFLGRLATIAERITPLAMKSLLRSRAVSTALLKTLGVSTANVVAEYNRLRPEISGEFSNAALWLALLLGPEIRSNDSDGPALTWVLRGSWFDVQRSRAALAQARKILLG